MDKQTLKAHLKQYAMDELITVEHIRNPSHAQINRKMHEIACWPMFVKLFQQYRVVIA